MKEFDNIRLTLSSPEDILKRSRGAVEKSETINYRTLVPEPNGLFSERIFGPTRDYVCACGKYKGLRYKGVVCEKCSVEVTRSKVRRERMAHIDLAVPVANIWYLKGSPNYMSGILGITTKDLENVVYYNKNIVIDPGKSSLKKHDVISDRELGVALSEDEDVVAKSGAAAIREALENINLEDLHQEILNELDEIDSAQKRKKLLKKLDMTKAFIRSGNRPENMIFVVLPVMPADIRPMVQLGGGRFATSDVNELYRKVINRNRRLKKLQDMMAPEIILKNEKRMLQEAVDALIDNDRRANPAVTQNNRVLKSLSDTLKGKQGRFRQNLLGKRVDYSGRSVIVVGPDLKLDQCGLPKKMALELYKPFIMRALVQQGYVTNIKSAKRMVDAEKPEVWAVAEQVIKEHPVLLNRAPSLHRASIRAFHPILIEGKAIRLHPLVCSGFNADFDGDQMSVHLVISPEAIMEAKVLMMADTNILSPASGGTLIAPSKEMLMGCYYATLVKGDAKGTGRAFSSLEEAELAYTSGHIGINAAIKTRVNGKIVETTAGRIILNNILPEEFRNYEKHYIGKDLKKLLSEIYDAYGTQVTADVANKIKDFGFEMATIAGITIGIDDLAIPTTKDAIIKKATKAAHNIEEEYKKGELVNEERYRKVTDVWNSAVEELIEDLKDQTSEFNSIYMMSKSGARGSLTQMRQLSGMRGLMSNTQGKVMEIPIKSNFREGLTALEFFMSSYGARKGAADRSLRTADSGYLTRRLVDASHDIIVKEKDCGTNEGILIKDLILDGKVLESFEERAIGRYMLEDLELSTGEVISNKDMLTKEVVDKITEAGIRELYVRSSFTCRSVDGVCVKCFGMDLSSKKPVLLGEAVGVVAAQSVSEPTTQLTMRTFHTGGVSEKESSIDKIVAEKATTVKYEGVQTIKKDSHFVVTNYGQISLDGKTFNLKPGTEILIKDGGKVKKGEVVAKINPHTINLIAKEEGYVDFSEVMISERANSRTGLKERVVVKSSSSSEISYIYLKHSIKGEVIAQYPVKAGSYILVKDKSKVMPGDVLAKTLEELEESKKDITGGLPRVQNLLEARIPAIKAVISEISGEVELLDSKKKGMRVIKVSNDDETRQYTISAGSIIAVNDGDSVEKGDVLTDGPLYVGDILAVKGATAAQMFVTEGVQTVYREQGVHINSKHIEVIVRQMFKKVIITDTGDSTLSLGEVITTKKANRINEDLLATGKRAMKFERVVQGVTKAAIGTESFISASSFQETTKVLASAAIKGKIDKLTGLKENVIIGRKIPAGTGFEAYKKVVKE